ncbi:MAG: septum formation protein Maf [bacterium]|nr:septum formation protein Maf [bacterium]
MSVRLTLVSASPRRRELLGQLGIPFDVCPSHAAELWIAETPQQLAIANATRKAEKSKHATHSGRLLLAADTIIAFEDEIFAKPAGPDAALRMLSRLAGRWHHVITGHCLYYSGGETATQAVEATTSEVRFCELTRSEMRHYLNSGEWVGKAGGYAIQGEAGKFVAELRGDRDNVIGLPVEAIKRSLGRHFSHCKFL